MTSDLFAILDKFKEPVIRRTESRRHIPPGSFDSDCITDRRDYKSVISKRFSFTRDDLDLLPLLPRRGRYTAAQQRRMQIPDYDLNAISMQNTVQDALHFYENLHFYRERYSSNCRLKYPRFLCATV